MRVRAAAVLGACLVTGVLPVATASADLAPGATTFSGISNFGRLIAPFGSLSQLSFFPIAGAMTPDGRFVWTVGTGHQDKHWDIQISNAATGAIVQQFEVDVSRHGHARGVTISHDGTRAYVSDARDQVDVYDVDPASGHAVLDAKPTIALPPPPGTEPPDDFPPNQPTTPPPAPQPPGFPGPNHGQPTSYPEGLALSADDRTLVVALNLSDHVAVVDTATRTVQQVQVRTDGAPGDRAYPASVAVAGGRAFVTDEGDGTVAFFDLANPSGIQRVTPSFTDPSGVNPKRTHPSGIVASPDANHVFVSLSSDDQVLELDASNPAHVERRFDARRVTGLGTQPVGLAVAPDGSTLFVADLGEDVLRAYALTTRDVRLPSGVTHLPPPVHGGGGGGGATRARERYRRERLRLPPSKRKKHGKLASRRVRAAAANVLTVHPGTELARIPAGIYPRQVMIAPDARRLVAVASKGVGPGSTFLAGESVSQHELGALQRFGLPASGGARDTALVAAGEGGQQTPVPVDHRDTAPAGSPLVGANGGASNKIKYVFYVVTENKTFDIILGDLGRGNGDPCLAIYGATRSVRHRRDGSACPQSGYGIDDGDRSGLNPGQRMDNTPITPNEHKLAKQWVTLDNAYSNSETSDDGHIWTSAAYAPEYDVRATLESPHPFDLLYPVSAPPKGFFFDSAVRQGVSFFNYGEAAAGLAFPDSQATPEENSVRGRVLQNSEYITQYPSSGAINKDPITQRETIDHDPCQLITGQPGVPCPQLNPAKQVSRMQYFSKRFQQQIASCPTPADPSTCAVPRYNELLFPNNHTSGTSPGTRTPDALVRDTDEAIGQFLDEVSHSAIWPYTAVFIIQDDAQDGADHVEGHRITSFVASPYARRGAVVSTHYDTVSVIRTIELILGMKPTYMYDALARPMWEAFQSTPNTGPFGRMDMPESLMEEKNGQNAPMAKTSARYVWVADAVPENVMNQLDWAYRYGTARACPHRVGRIPHDPCESDGSEVARKEIAKGRATVAALRRLYARGGR